MFTPPRNLALTAALALATALPLAARADEDSIVPDDAMWVVRFNTTTLTRSDFGQSMIQLIRDTEPEAMKFVAGLSDTLGVDLLTGLGEGVLFGQSYDRKDVTLALDLGPSAGNIEGLLMAAPGYESKVYRGDILIHSVLNEGEGRHDPATERHYLAIVPDSVDQAHTLVAAHAADAVEHMVDQLRIDGRELAPQPLPDGQFLAATLNNTPQNPMNVNVDRIRLSALINRVEMAGSADDQMRVVVEAEAIDALRARQLAQIVQGGAAALQLAALDQPKLERLGRFLTNMDVQHEEGQTTVGVSLRFTAEELMALRPEHLDL